MSHEQPDENLNALASNLVRLQPSPSRLDRDRVMFLAGEASGSRQSQRARLFWPAVSGTLAAAAALLMMVVINDRVSREVPRAAVVASQGPLVGKSPVAADETIVYWRLRTAALDDRWPATVVENPGRGATDSPVCDRQALLKELLGS